MTTASQSFSLDQFSRPLDVIRAEHDRQFLLSARLIELATDCRLGPVIRTTESLLAYLTEDLPLHCKDEEEDLFPLLRRRCLQEDGIESILAELDKDHAAERFLACHLVIDLRSIVIERRSDPPTQLFADLRVFAEGQRRHLSWENRTVLPLAHKRLRREDLVEMGRNMVDRRGIPYQP